MAEAAPKLPVKSEQKSGAPTIWKPFESLHNEIDRMFEDFGHGLGMSPFRRSLLDFAPFARVGAKAPAVDVVEKDKEFEITAELPGLEERDIEVKLANGGISIRGEKNESKEEKEKNYYLSERRYGSFERYFQLPDGIDADKVSATFKNGVLTLTLPKTAEAQKQERKIAVKAT